jgi:CrcB protein
MGNIALVAAGGSLGSVARYLISLLAKRLCPGKIGLGTLIVNLAGCFLIGLFAGLAERAVVSKEFRTFFVTGVLGGLTTFSTFSLETASFLNSGRTPDAIIYFGLNTGLGLLLALGGLALAARL